MRSESNGAREIMTSKDLCTGLLLCARPSESLPKPVHFSAGWATSSLEPLGFSRLKPHPDQAVEPIPAQIEYKKLLSDLRSSVLARQKENADRNAKRKRRMQIVREFCDRQRAAVRELMKSKAPEDEFEAVQSENVT